MRSVFSFPNPVNEVAARLVAGGVVLMSLAFLLTGETLILLVLAYGFLARVLTGPTLSPLGQLVTRVLVPILPFKERPVPGPPKRFAQGVGATLSVAAVVALVVFDSLVPAGVLVGMIAIAATLESVWGICLGCWLFALLMRAGIIPESVCEACADINRPRAAA